MELPILISEFDSLKKTFNTNDINDPFPESLRHPFPQIDIIGAVVRRKTIRSVLCNIVCNNCEQCDAHTYEQTNSSVDWVLSHWAHFTVLRFIFMVALCNRTDHYISAL